jgi:hypothetical protein
LDEYDLYLRGFAPNAAETSELGLLRVFGLPAEPARELLRSLPRVVKRRIPASELERYLQALSELGADYELRRSLIRPARTLLVEGEDDDEHGTTLSEHRTKAITLPPPRIDPSRPAGGQTWGERLDLGAPPAPRPAPAREHAADSGSLASAWHTSESLAGGGAARGPQPELRELPPSWQIPGLQLDGRPDWLVDGPAAIEDHLLPNGPPELDLSSLPPERQRTLQSERLTLDPVRPSATGTIAGRELPAGPPRWVRWLLALGLGLSLFVIVWSARRYSSSDFGIGRVLARWRNLSVSSSPTVRSLAPRDESAEAETWLEPEENQIASGDKDRARLWIARFREAGALGVHIGQIQRKGTVRTAAELVVTLPHDYEARRRVLHAYREYLEATFGGIAAEVHDPTDDQLHVAL